MGEKSQQFLEQNGLLGLLVSSEYSMRYLSGFTGGTGYLLLTKEKKLLFTDSRYTTQAESETEGFEIFETSGEKNYQKLLREVFCQNGWPEDASFGYEDTCMTCAELRTFEKAFPAVLWVALGEKLNDMRMIKTEEELTAMSRAAQIADRAFSHILTVLQPGISELYVAAELESAMKKQGASKLSFETIAASGLHSAMPHAAPSEKLLEPGDFLTLDFGCIYQGYCSDMTRTVVIGKAEEKQRYIYRTVLEAQEQALHAIRAGKTGAEIDAVARNFITKEGFGNYFGHGLGHSVGLYIHESPRLSPADTTVLQEHMVETVEPGIYIPGFGGVRIEDMVVVTRDGCRNMVHAPKQLIEISADKLLF